MNSPEPVKSIKILSEALLAEARIGAGTVLAVAQVHDVARAGGQLIVSPDTVPEVIAATKEASLIPIQALLHPASVFPHYDTVRTG